MADQGLMAQITRDRIGSRQRERWARLKLFDPIREAADAGDERLAIKLLREYIRNRKQEAA